MSATTINLAEVVETPKSTLLQYIVLTLCSLVLFVDGFDTQAISYIVPRVAKEWHIHGSALGPIFSSALIGLLMGYLVISSLSDKFGHKRVMIIATAFFGVFTLVTARVTSVPELVALRFLTGLGLGGAAPSAVALTSEYCSSRVRATFVLIIYCGFSLGFVAAGFTAAALLPLYGWPSLLWVGGALPLILCVMLAVALPESLGFLARRGTRPEQLRAIVRRLGAGAALGKDTVFVLPAGEGKRAAVVSLFKRGRVAGTLLLWLVFFLNLAIFYFMQSWLPTILTRLHYTMHIVVWVTALPTIGGTVCVFVVGPAIDRFGPYRTLRVLYLFSGVFMALTAVAFASTLWMLMAAIFMAGFCVSGGQKGIIALSAIFYPTDIRSTGVGWALGIGRFGSIAGPAVAGVMFNAGWNATQVFYAGTITILCAGVAIHVMGRFYDTKRDIKRNITRDTQRDTQPVASSARTGDALPAPARQSRLE